MILLYSNFFHGLDIMNKFTLSSLNGVEIVQQKNQNQR